MPQLSRSPRIVRFGVFEFDIESGELRKLGVRIKLQGQPAQILSTLIERAGEVVTREELREKLWRADTFVDFEHSLNAAVKRLRRALKDSAEKPRYIETVARRGYRFIASVEPRAERDTGPLQESVHSLAVLPFQNTSADPEVEYLADGITETIISSLSRLREVRVMARSTVFRYKTRQGDPRALGRRLDVDAVLIGRVLQRGEGLQIGTELVEVRNGWQIWGEQYNRTLSDLLRVQDEISHEIFETLSARLGGDETRAARPATRNPQAYRAYLKGRYYWNKTTENGLKTAIAHFEEAVAKDPDYALAHVGLADSYSLFGFYGLMPPASVMPKAREEAMLALALDDSLAEAHASLAGILKSWDWDWAAAETEYRRALELNPNYETGRRFYAAYLAAVGRHEEALKEIHRAQELDPLSLVISMETAWDSYMARAYEMSREQALRTLELEPNFSPAHHVLGLAYEQMAEYGKAVEAFERSLAGSQRNAAPLAGLAHALAGAGRVTEAKEILSELEEASRKTYVPPFWPALVCSGLGDPDAAFECLEKAYEIRDVWLVWLKQEPRLDPLRPDPRFDDLLRRLGLA